MYDTNLMFWSAAAITTTTSGTKAINKTPAAGVWIEAAITAVAGSTTGGTIDIVISESDDDNTYNNLVTFPRMTVAAAARVARLVQSQKKYLKATVTCGTGTGLAASLTLGVVTGPPQDEVS